MAGERSSCTLGPGSPNHSLFTSFLDGASPVSRRKQLEISDILRVSGLPADPRKKVDQKLARWKNADDTIRWNSSWRRVSYPSSSFFFDRDSGAAYRWADGRGIITKQELLEWGESRYGGQRVTLQRVRGSESGEGRREKSEMKRACRIALFKPNKICGITSQICRMVDARTFLLYICRRGNDGRRGGWMYVYACVCIYVCMCAWREERTMSTADGSWGRNDVRLEPGLKWENAPGNAPANCQPTLQRSLRIDVATVRNYSCPLLATFQRIGNSLWNSWNGDLPWWWKYTRNWLDIDTTLIFVTGYYHYCNVIKWLGWMVSKKTRSFF